MRSRALRTLVAVVDGVAAVLATALLILAFVALVGGWRRRGCGDAMRRRSTRDYILAVAAALVALITLGTLGVLLAAAIAGVLAAAGWVR